MSPATSRLAELAGTWGKPVDRVALVALVISLFLAIVAGTPERALGSVGAALDMGVHQELRRRVLLVMAFVSAFLSLGYLSFYLHAGPRIIDATSYFLEGRVLSHGHLSWPVSSPTASFRGRFLLFHEPDHLSVIFPPGFPLLLALGFLFRAPLVVGPVLAGLLVYATYGLASELAWERPPSERRAVATLAAALSTVCAALRYHTADTMAHGASALWVTLALVCALRAARTGRRRFWLLAGVSVGAVVCTRPVSSFAISFVVLVLAARERRVPHVVLGSLPGVLFLVLASRIQTGRWLVPAQSAYYAASDGPLGCFRYGFGSGIGCLGEHKDYVLSRLPHGFGLAEATLTTLRRLRMHLLDIANFEPLALLAIVPAAKRAGAPARGVLAASVVVLAQMAAYAPFYFDGDYPGGGARFFADVLPVEHALIALATLTLLPGIAFYRRALGVLSLSLFGFGVHDVFEHDALARRDGGRSFWPLEEVGHLDHGLLLVDTDHAFNLGYDPYKGSEHGVSVARGRADDHDRLVAARMGQTDVHVFHSEAGEHGIRPGLAPWIPKPGGTNDIWHFESEAAWPPLAQEGGWAEPVWASTTCADQGQVLTVHVDKEAKAAVVTIDLPVPRSGKWVVLPRVFRTGSPGHASLRLIPGERPLLPSDPKILWEWNDDDAGAKPGHETCIELPPLSTAHGTPLDPRGARLELTATGGDVSLDEVTLKAAR
jgi:hypothetical protein